MKGFTFIVCFILVLLITAVPVTATNTTISGDSITTVSPKSGLAGEIVEVTITGLNFTTQTGSVRLEMDDESDIDASSITSWSPSQIVCRFNIKSTKEPGEWDVVVVKGYDDTVIVKANGFAITTPPTISSISPTSGQADDEIDFTITGKDFDEELIEEIFLYNEDYDNITADNDFDVSSDGKKITGTFDLDDADDDTYQLCIEDKYGAVVCKKKAFEITSNEYGTIEISSSPSDATIYIDDKINGTTPRNIDIIVGSYKVTLKKAGYSDWSKIVNVYEDEDTEVDVTLYAAATATPTPTRTAAETTARTATPRTTVKSTIKIPTTWVDPVTTAAESPVDPALIIGSLGLAFIALRRR